MYLMPLSFLLAIVAGLISMVFLVGGIYIVWAWHVGELIALSWLVSGIAMLLWSALGRSLVLMFYPRGNDEPHVHRSEHTEKIEGADGSILHVEFEGPVDGPTIILTHGWALDSTAWYYIRRELSKRYRLVLWDLPGLGKSTQPSDGVSDACHVKRR